MLYLCRRNSLISSGLIAASPVPARADLAVLFATGLKKEYVAYSLGVDVAAPRSGECEFRAG
jgi:hypothetical protein